jgi:hypothetical protein
MAKFEKVKRSQQLDSNRQVEFVQNILQMKVVGCFFLWLPLYNKVVHAADALAGSVAEAVNAAAVVDFGADIVSVDLFNDGNYVDVDVVDVDYVAFDVAVVDAIISAFDALADSVAEAVNAAAVVEALVLTLFLMILLMMLMLWMLLMWLLMLLLLFYCCCF